MGMTRTAVSLLLAMGINGLLLTLIYQLVNRTPILKQDLEEIHIVELVRYEPRNEPLKKQQPLEQKQPPRPRLQPETPQFKTQPPDRPKPPRLDRPNLALELPVGVTGGPYIGDFQPAPMLQDFKLIPTLQIPPVYPSRAKRTGIEGRIIVEFTIKKDGSVKDPKVIQAKPELIFDRSVLRAIRQWKFNPKKEGGELVEWRAQKEFVFRLKSR